MSRRRKLLVLVSWLLPPFFAGSAGFVDKGTQFSDEIAILLILLGPVILTLLLSSLLFVRAEHPEVRYVRASRRLGYMCKLAAVGVLAVGYLAKGALTELVLFLFFAMITLAFASVVFRMLQVGSIEDGGARDSVLVTAVMIVFAALVLPGLNRYEERDYFSSCSNNLKQLGLVCKMFANETSGLYPELSPKPGYLSMANMADGYTNPVFPEYLSDGSVLICPKSAQWEQRGETPLAGQEIFDSSSYVYLGYAVTSKEELETFFQCYKERIAAGLPFNEDLPAPPGRGSGGGDKILRLRQGAESAYIKNWADYRDGSTARLTAQAHIPILIERPGNHEKPRGINVLYMDGHAEFLKYPGEWPATPGTFSTIEAIERMRPARESRRQQ